MRRCQKNWGAHTIFFEMMDSWAGRNPALFEVPRGRQNRGKKDESVTHPRDRVFIAVTSAVLAVLLLAFMLGKVG
jgi:hypothetical protein